MMLCSSLPSPTHPLPRTGVSGDRRGRWEGRRRGVCEELIAQESTRQVGPAPHAGAPQVNLSVLAGPVVVVSLPSASQ